MKTLVSSVENHEGPCVPTWINNNQVLNRQDGGVTGYFKNTKRVWYWPFPVKHGKEFHGKIVGDVVVPARNYHTEADEERFIIALSLAKELNRTE